MPPSIKLNATLKDLTNVIDNVNNRLKDIEKNQTQHQLHLHELKLKVDNLIRGDN